MHSNLFTPSNILGNLAATRSDHFPEFLITPDIFSNQPSIKLNIFERNWFTFDQENFILGYISVDWENLIKLDNRNVERLASFLFKVNPI